MKKLMLVLSLLMLPLIAPKAYAGLGANQDIYGNMGTFVPASITVGSASVAGAQVIVASFTSTTVGGAATFDYITNIHIEMTSTATIAGTSILNDCTSQNLPGNIQWDFPTANAVGSNILMDMQFANPLKSTLAGQAVLITCPRIQAAIWNIIISGYNSN